MYTTVSSRKTGNLKTPGPLSVDVMIQTDTMTAHNNRGTVRICLARKNDSFVPIIDLTMTPEEALKLAKKLTTEVGKL